MSRGIGTKHEKIGRLAAANSAFPVVLGVVNRVVGVKFGIGAAEASLGVQCESNLVNHLIVAKALANRVINGRCNNAVVCGGQVLVGHFLNPWFGWLQRFEYTESKG